MDSEAKLDEMACPYLHRASGPELGPTADVLTPQLWPHVSFQVFSPQGPKTRAVPSFRQQQRECLDPIQP